MKRILITGLSGTGKTSVIEELRARGFEAIDTDYDGWCEQVTADDGPEWVWREARMHELLTAPRETPLFVSGCCSNQGKFYQHFDAKVLLSAPIEVILERVAGRASNPYGKSEAERAEIRGNYEWVQPLLQKSANFEVDSSAMSVQEMTDFLEGIALGR